jgi:predicted MPP superfamily phosphohydrolase
MKAFFFMAGSVYTLINSWVIWWVWRTLAETGLLRLGVILIIVICWLVLPLLIRGSGNSALELALVRMGAFWMGILFYILALVIISDAISLLVKLTGISFPVIPGPVKALLVLGLPLILGSAGWLNAAYPVVKKYELSLNVDYPVPEPYRKDGLTIAAMSDLHLGRIITTARLKKAVGLIWPYKPEAVFFLGDLLDDQTAFEAGKLKEALAPLKPPLGLWGITGNHEYYAAHGDIAKSVGVLEQSGITMLLDDWRVLGGTFLLVGRDDSAGNYFKGSPRKSLEDVLKTIPEPFRNLPLIVLDHQPSSLREAQKAGADLQLCGHTHNGQLWPFNYITDRIFENAYGYSQSGPCQFIVTAGTGTWGPPMRNNSRPEVLLVRLNFTDSQNSGSQDLEPKDS